MSQIHLLLQTGFGRGVSLFEREKLILNLGFDAYILGHPVFDSRGWLLALGNQDGTVTACNIRALKGHFKELGLP